MHFLVQIKRTSLALLLAALTSLRYTVYDCKALTRIAKSISLFMPGVVDLAGGLSRCGLCLSDGDNATGLTFDLYRG